MTEEEYLCATNRVKVSIALQVMRDVLPGDYYGISDNEKAEIIKKLSDAKRRLWDSYSILEAE